MAARPPPTRPHINLNPSSHFSYSITEWGEDDAWDSTSDSESVSNTQSVWGRPLNQPGHPRPSGVTSTPTSTSAPKPVPVPRKSQNSSSSTLAFSYTHVSAPSPTGSSPFPSHGDSIPPTTMKNGWTIVQKAGEDGRDGAEAALPPPGSQQHSSGAADEADNDMTFEDLGDELFVDMPVVPKVRLGAACVRQDAAEIANGAWPVSQHFLCQCMRWIYTHAYVVTQILYAFLNVPWGSMIVQSPHPRNARDRRLRSTGNGRKS
jgi:TBC1 domain family member 2